MRKGEGPMSKKKAAKKTKKKIIKKAIKKTKAKKKVAKKVAKKIVKKVGKKPVKKAATKKKVIKKSVKKKAPKKAMKIKDDLLASLVELIKKTSTIIPEDVHKVILETLQREKEGTTAKYAMDIIEANIKLAETKSQPMCQDTGTILFFISHPASFSEIAFMKVANKAVVFATQKGYLRQNSVDTLTGSNTTMNLGPGHPSFHFHEHKKKSVEVRLMLKGGGCENVGAQYSLPNVELNAGRDLDGVRRVILDAVLKAQGKGCGPGVLGVTIGGDRGAGYMDSKEQLLRKLGDESPTEELAKLEKEIVLMANKLGIGPMGFGGKTTLLGCKVGTLNRLPASYFVSISYMCWAFRRHGISLGASSEIKRWLY